MPEKADSEPGRKGWWIRLPLWILLVAWLVFLAASLLVWPEPEPTPAGSDTAPDDAPSVPAQPGPPATTPVAVPDAPNALAARVAVFALNEDFDSALELIRGWTGPEPDPAGRRSLAQMVHEVSLVDDRISEAFAERIGETTEIRRGNRKLVIVPRAVSGGTVNATVGTGEKQRSVTFSVRSLDPLERSRWLGRADSPADCAMHCILHARVGDYATARAYAEGAGALAEPLLTNLASM